jgi:hypothetical protein
MQADARLRWDKVPWIEPFDPSPVLQPRKKPTLATETLFCLEIQAPRACRPQRDCQQVRALTIRVHRHRLYSGKQYRTLASKLRHQGCILALNALKRTLQ